MKLSWRILLLVFIITAFSGLAHFLITQYQVKSLHKDSETILANTIFQSLRDALVQDVIDGNRLRVTNLLRKLQANDNPVEFLYVTEGDAHNIFAHSFKGGFPRYLLAHEEDPAPQTGMQLSHKYQTSRGLIFEYAEPLIPGLDATLHIGINQSEIMGKLAENTQYIIKATIVIIFFTMLIAYIWGRRITTPLVQFASKLEHYGEGEIDHTVEYHSHIKLAQNNEIGMLGRAFNHMQKNIFQREKDLQDSRSHIRLLLDSTSEAIYGIDLTGGCTFVNQSCLKLLGYDEDSELLGKNMHDMIHHTYADGTAYPKDACFIFQAFQKLEKVHVDDEVLWRRDGSSFPAEYWSYPILKDGECVGSVVTFLDISDRLAALKALKESEQDLAITLNSIGDAVIATDAGGLITRMNPVAEKLTGWSLIDALGKTVKDVFPIVNAATRKPIENPVEKVLATGETVYLSNHTTLIAKDGKEYQIADSAAPIINNGKILGMVLVFNDVTKQYQLREDASKSKRDMQAIMDHAPAAIYAKDIQGRFIFINKHFEKLSNTRSEDIVGKNQHGLFSQKFTDEILRHDKEVLAKGQAMEFDLQFSQDEGTLSYHSTKFPLFDEEGKIYAVCGISTDITDRKKQEEQLRRSMKMEALGKLTGGIAHDYNNMLGVILGYSEILQNELGNQPKLNNYIQQIHIAGKRGADLTKKLLSFSRGKSTDKIICSINSLLLEQRLMLEKTLTARIKLKFDLDDDLWNVKLDSGDFEDAILNMSINAMHAMEGRGQLTLETTNITLTEPDILLMDMKAGDYISLSLTDTGCGIDNATKENLFDPFFTTKGEMGTGLGLAQVYGFVQRNGGIIKVHSEINHGTCFTLYFPRYDEEGSSETTELEEQQQVYETLKGTETILAVDDEPSMLGLTYDILTMQGYNVLTADSGQQALRILKTEPVDLLLSDVIMPDMDGYELAVKVHEKYPEIKIQLVSGFSDNRHTQQVSIEAETWYREMLYKPYEIKSLLKRLREILLRTQDT